MKFYILLTLFLISCSTISQDQNNNKCLEIHNNGVDLIMRTNDNDSLQILNAIDIFNKSIECDPTIFLSYMMKIQCFLKIDDKIGVFETCKSYQENYQEESPFIFFYFGYYYEDINKLDSSQYYYDKAISLANKVFLDSRSSDHLLTILLMNRLIISNQQAIKILNENIDLLEPDEIMLYKEFLGKSKTEIIHSL